MDEREFETMLALLLNISQHLDRLATSAEKLTDGLEAFADKLEEG